MLRGLISLVIVGSLVLAITALVVAGPGALGKVLPASAVAYLEDLGVFGTEGTRTVREGDLPVEFLDDSVDGLEVRGPIAARPGNAPVFIADVVTGYGTSVSTSIPAEITTIRPILGCLLTPPQPGTVVGHATAGRSGMPLALSTYNDAQLAEAVQGFVDLYRKTGEPDAFVEGGSIYEAYDVAVTETSAPVYLVLENRTGNRIWNIHLAAGARIERVVLLGGEQAGVANLDPVVPIEVILNDGLAGCGIEPAYELNAGHLFFQSVQNGTLTTAAAEAQLAEIFARADAYDIWFRDSFGVLASESRAGFDVGTLSHFGPVPGPAEPKAVYAPIAGAKIRTTQDKFFEIRGQEAEGASFSARVRSIATAFAFGDLSNLMQGVDF